MPHVFDHGLARPIRSLVRDGVAAALAPLNIDNGGYLIAIKPFAMVIRGRDDGDAIDHAWEVLQGQSPAVLVALGDTDYQQTGATGHQWHGDLAVQVVVHSAMARSLEERLTGDVTSVADVTADPGIEVMLEHVRQLLTGNDLDVGPEVWQLRLDRELELETNKAGTMFALTFRVQVNGAVLEHRTALVRIREFLATWRARAEVGGDAVHTFTTETTTP